jgi:hypothetical protein
MEEENTNNDGMIKKCRKKLNKLLSSDDEPTRLPPVEHVENTEVTTEVLTNSGRRTSRSNEKKPSPRDEKKPSPRDILLSATRIRRPSHEKDVIPIQERSLSPPRRKSAKRSQSANDAIQKERDSETILSSAREASKGTSPLPTSPQTTPINIERTSVGFELPKNSSSYPRISVSPVLNHSFIEKKHKFFEVMIVRGLTSSGSKYETLDIDPVECESRFLVENGYKCIEIDEIGFDVESIETIESCKQIYLLYSRVPFEVSEKMQLSKNNFNEEKAIELFRKHFPIIVKSVVYFFTKEDFKHVFLNLMYTIYEKQSEATIQKDELNHDHQI